MTNMELLSNDLLSLLKQIEKSIDDFNHASISKNKSAINTSLVDIITKYVDRKYEYIDVKYDSFNYFYSLDQKEIIEVKIAQIFKIFNKKMAFCYIENNDEFNKISSTYSKIINLIIYFTRIEKLNNENKKPELTFFENDENAFDDLNFYYLLFNLTNKKTNYVFNLVKNNVIHILDKEMLINYIVRLMSTDFPKDLYGSCNYFISYFPTKWIHSQIINLKENKTLFIGDRDYIDNIFTHKLDDLDNIIKNLALNVDKKYDTNFSKELISISSEGVLAALMDIKKIPQDDVDVCNFENALKHYKNVYSSYYSDYLSSDLSSHLGDAVISALEKCIDEKEENEFNDSVDKQIEINKNKILKLTEEEKYKLVIDFLKLGQLCSGKNNLKHTITDEMIKDSYLKIRNNKDIIGKILTGQIIIKNTRDVFMANYGDVFFDVTPACIIKSIECYLKEVLIQFFPKYILMEPHEPDRKQRDIARSIYYHFNNESELSTSDIKKLTLAQTYYALCHISIELRKVNDSYELFRKNINFYDKYVERIRNPFLHTDSMDCLKEDDICGKTAYWLILFTQEFDALQK